MINKLPQDVFVNILSRLHIGQFFRLTYVCKTWYTIVCDPLFFVIYFGLSPRTNTNTFVLHCTSDTDWETPLWLIQDGEKDKPLVFPLNKFKKLKFPLSLSLSKSCPLVSQAILMGSCNGLLCLSAVDVYPQGSSNIPRNPIYILNAITQVYQQVPELPSLRCDKVLSGFGFDVSRYKFKVVLVLFYKETSIIRNEVVIHTLGNSTWRRRTSLAPKSLFEAFEVNSPAFINGSLHWMTMEPKKHYTTARSLSRLKIVIVAFRMGLETFRMIPTPKTLGMLNTELQCPLKHYGLGVLQGCLSLTDFSSEKFAHIWLMKNFNGSESWVKMFSLKRQSTECQSFLPITLRRNGEILLMCDDKYLVSYNTETNKWIPIRDFKNEKLWKSSIQVFPVDLSIISPKLACGVQLF